MTMEMLPMYIIAGVGGLFVLLLYFTPTVVAMVRKVPHPTNNEVMVSVPNLKFIFLTNLLLGWTFIIWVVCLIWAFTSGSKTTARVANMAKTYAPRATEEVLGATEEALEDLLPAKDKKSRYEGEMS